MNTNVATHRIISAMQESPVGFTVFADSYIPFRPPVEAFLVGGVVPSLILEGTVEAHFAQVEEWYSNALNYHTASLVGPLVGGWENNGKFYLDLITVVFSEDRALELGRTRGELAIGRMDSTGAFKELVLN